MRGGKGWGLGEGRDVFAMYFCYAAAAEHVAGCSRAGTDLWEVTRYTQYNYTGTDEVRETTVRLVCHECHTVHFERSPGLMERETVPASEAGYGAAPEKVAGLWLHPGRPLPFPFGKGPERYYITRCKDRPALADVLGMVAWTRGPRGGTRWGAGAGLTEWGSAERGSGQQWASRTAAVRWVAAQHAVAAGDGGE